MYDVIIVGAGPAGITAAIYAARKRMNCLVLTQTVGGQAVWSGAIENYTGYQFITGVELVSKFEEHMRGYGVTARENEPVTLLEAGDKSIIVRTSKTSYESRTAIVASGKVSSLLNVPGEMEFRNKGVSYCATCDGPLFADKPVAVIGGGNSALDAALQLVRIASHVFIVNRQPSLSGDTVMREHLLSASNITVLDNASITEITGGTFVDGIRLRQGSEERAIPVRGVFIEIGLMPNTAFAPSLEKNALGEIIVNCENETNIPGVFAAGDVTNVPEKQIIIAAGEGAKACLGAFRFLATHRFSF